MSLKRRVENLENANSGGYRTIERILEIINLEKRADHTPAESARLKVLNSLPLEPKLQKFFAGQNPENTLMNWRGVNHERERQDQAD